MVYFSLIFALLMALFPKCAESYSCEEFCQESDPCEQSFCCSIGRFEGFEVSAGYFLFADSKLRKRCDRGGYQLALSSQYSLNRHFYLFGQLGYLECRDSSKCDSEQLKIREYPAAIGLQWLYRISGNSQLSLALAPSYLYFRLDNRFKEGYLKENKNSFGGLAKGAFSVRYCGRYFCSLFAEYSYHRVHLSCKSESLGGHRQVGGVTCGVAVSVLCAADRDW